jgi:hypothetical protein
VRRPLVGISTSAILVAAESSFILRVEFLIMHLVIRELFVERLTIANTASQEPGPWRNGDLDASGLRQQGPKIRMVPAEIVTRGIAMRSNSRAQFPDLSRQFLPAHAIEIFIHLCSSVVWGETRLRQIHRLFWQLGTRLIQLDRNSRFLRQRCSHLTLPLEQRRRPLQHGDAK